MTIQKTNLLHIPVIVWGKPSRRAYIYITGKGGVKEDACGFAALAEQKGYQTISFDLPEHGERTDTEHRLDIWNGMRDLDIIADYAFEQYDEVCLYAGSIGAYFALNTYARRSMKKCLFQAPIVDMRRLVELMMTWFDVTPERLEREGEIPTPIDPLRWDYYQHILAHPVENWPHPTAILYGGEDELQPREVMERFAARFGAELTVSEHSDHPFSRPGDGEIIENWLNEHI